MLMLESAPESGVWLSSFQIALCSKAFKKEKVKRGCVGHKLETPGKRKPQLRKCLHQMDLWACWGRGHFLD